MAAGTFTTATLTADDSVLSKLKVGDTYYKCTAAGTTYFSSTRAYGPWEFSFFKATPATGTAYIKFLSQGPVTPVADSGYGLIIATNRSIAVSEYASGTGHTKLTTGSNYLSATATWHSYRITRTIAGSFNVFIKGGDFGDTYGLVPAFEGLGTNPFTDTTYTTSSYMVFDFDVGDGFLWTRDERTTSLGACQYGVNPLLLPVPKTNNAVSLTV